MLDPILITGAARSGTSMTAGIISICGAFGGDMFGPNEFNQKGMFENKEIRQDIVKPYLRKIGVDPLGQFPLPNNRQVFEVSNKQVEVWRKLITESIVKQGYKEGEWFYKGAKSCLVWYLWYLAFHDAKWVIVRRRAKDIAHSCLRTRFMKSYQTEKEWLGWVEVHERRFDEMKLAGLNIKEFWPSEVINGNFDKAKEMIEWLGLEWKEKLVRAFIDPSLYSSK